MQTFSTWPKNFAVLFQDRMVQLVAHYPHPTIRRCSLNSPRFSLEEMRIAGLGNRQLHVSSWSCVRPNSQQNDFLVWDYGVHCFHGRGGRRWKVAHFQTHTVECQKWHCTAHWVWCSDLTLYSGSTRRTRGSVLDHAVWDSPQQPVLYVLCILHERKEVEECPRWKYDFVSEV